MRFLFLLLFSFLTATGAFAQGTCGGLFAEATPSSLVQEITALAGQKSLTQANSQAHQGTVERLGLEIFNLHHDAIIQETRKQEMRDSGGRTEFLDPALNIEVLRAELKSGDIVFSIAPEKFLTSSHLHTYKGTFTRDGEEVLDFSIRTNGFVAFLDSSFQYRSSNMMDYQAVALSQGKLVSTSMTEMVFNSLGENITLSRTMQPTERELWIQKESSSLGSRNYFQRIHFALNYYYFNGAPYSAQIPKALLRKLFADKKLEINSYDSRESRAIGMPDVARTPFGLEVEFVISHEAAFELVPYLSPALRQGVLDFGQD